MAKEENGEVKTRRFRKGPGCGGCGAGGAVYFFGFLGAAFYFIQHAATLGDGLWGILKAIIWPSLFVYKLLEFFRF